MKKQSCVFLLAYISGKIILGNKMQRALYNIRSIKFCKNHTFKIPLQYWASDMLGTRFKSFQRGTINLCRLGSCKLMGRQSWGFEKIYYVGQSLGRPGLIPYCCDDPKTLTFRSFVAPWLIKIYSTSLKISRPSF